MCWQRGSDTGRLLHRVGELGRVGGGQCDHRHRPVPPRGAAAPRPTAVWGSMRIPVAAWVAAITAIVSSSSTRAASKTDVDGVELVGLDHERSRRPEALELLGRHAAVAVVQLEQEALEVGAHLDVHARAERRHDDAVAMIPECRKRVRMSLRFEPITSRSTGSPIRRATQPGEDVAEVAGRDGERRPAPPPRCRRGAST